MFFFYICHFLLWFKACWNDCFCHIFAFSILSLLKHFYRIGKCVINGSNNSAFNLQHKQMLCEDTFCFVIFLYSVILSTLKYYSIIVIKYNKNLPVYIAPYTIV